MTFEIEGGLVVSINKQTRLCSVVHSPKAAGTVMVPRFVEIEGQKYVITSISEYSFCNAKIDLLAFPDDSEVMAFKENALSNTYIKKLKIPPSLRSIDYPWCLNLQGLTDIEISPDNKFFLYLDNSYLLTKSKGSDQFDTLIYARNDIENALIPSQVKIIEQFSFNFHK